MPRPNVAWCGTIGPRQRYEMRLVRSRNPIVPLLQGSSAVILALSNTALIRGLTFRIRHRAGTPHHREFQTNNPGVSMTSSAARTRDVAKSVLAIVGGTALIACSSAKSGDQNTSADSAPVGTARAENITGSAAITSGSENPGTNLPVAARLPAPPPARDADQEFLRHMLDHNETVLAIVHAQMMEPAGHAEHGKAVDPAAWDSKIDVDKREMLALLKKHYNEDYSPRVIPSSSTVGSASSAVGMTMPPAGAGRKDEADAMAGQVEVAAHLRDGVEMADRFAPKLTRPEVRALARRIRASQLQLARELSAGMPSR